MFEWYREWRGARWIAKEMRKGYPNMTKQEEKYWKDMWISQRRKLRAYVKAHPELRHMKMFSGSVLITPTDGSPVRRLDMDL